MSAPRIHKDKLQGALYELISAMSSLNMYPEPCPAPEDSRGYLSECDAWAKHAMEHMRAAFDLINQAHHEREVLKGRIHQLEKAQKSA